MATRKQYAAKVRRWIQDELDRTNGLLHLDDLTEEQQAELVDHANRWGVRQAIAEFLSK